MIRLLLIALAARSALAGTHRRQLHRRASTHSIDCSLPIDTATATCGGSTGFRCAETDCCSQYGFCGSTEAHCAAEGCDPLYGSCADDTATCSADGTSSSARPEITPVSSNPTVLTPVRASTLPKCPSTKGLIAQYYPTWTSQTAAQIPWAYSDLTFFFVAVTSKDGFQLDSSSTAKIASFVQTAKQKKSKAILTIGGWTGSIYFSSLVSTATSRAQFAKNIAAFVANNQFDGVDLDWEYPNSPNGLSCNQKNAQDTANLLEFLKVLRVALGTKKLITAAVAPQGFIGPDDKALADASQFAKYLDYLVLMVYDIFGSWSDTSGPNAPLDSSCSNIKSSGQDSVQYWTKAGFPACRLLLGVPAYAHSFTTLSSSLQTLTVNGKKTQLYQKISPITPKGDSTDVPSQGGVDACGVTTSASNNYAGSWTYQTLISEGVLSANGQTGLNGFKRYYDTCSQTPFLFNSQRKYLISYDDATSVAAKAKWAKSKGLAGVAVFASNGFNTAVNKVIRQNI